MRINERLWGHHLEPARIPLSAEASQDSKDKHMPHLEGKSFKVTLEGHKYQEGIDRGHILKMTHSVSVQSMTRSKMPKLERWLSG